MKARHRRVLELLQDGWSYEKIARAFNVSVDRVRQVEREAREHPEDDSYNERGGLFAAQPERGAESSAE